MVTPNITKGQIALDPTNDLLYYVNESNTIVATSLSWAKNNTNIQTTENVVIDGDLTVSGTTVTISTETLLIEDNIIVLNTGVTATPSTNAGIEVERGTSTNVLIRWNESTDKWELTNDGTTYGNILTTVDSGIITSNMIADGTIVNADINASAAIDHSKLANATAGQVLLGTTTTGVVTATTISGDVTITGAGVTAIGSGVIVDADVSSTAAIAHSKLANATAGQVLLGTTTTGVVTATTISGDVTISGAGVTAIGTGVIVNADVSSTAAIAHSKLANATAGQILLGTTTTGVVTATTVSGDVTITGAGVTAIASDVIVNADINASAAIDHTKLATTTAGYLLMGNATGVIVGTVVSGDVTITSAGNVQIASGAIVNADINASAAIDKTKISGTAITAADIGTVTSTMILDGTILNADINASAAIALSKLASGTSAQVILANSTGVPTYTTLSGDVTISNTGVVSIAANSVALGTDTTGNYMSDVTAGTGISISHTPGEGSTATISVDTSVIQSRVANVSDTEISYLDGVTSSIQSQINNKASLSSATFTGNVTTPVLYVDSIEIDTTGATTGQVLKFDGTKFVPGTDNVASAGSLNIEDLNNVTITTASIGQFLKWNGTDWVNATLTKSDAGLGNVDNTSDLNKPISNSTQTALDLKANSNSSPVITLAGDLTGSVTLTNLSNATLTATIAANSVALGTDTTGNYVQSLVAGTGITLTNATASEGGTPTIAVTANTYQPLDADLTAIAALAGTSGVLKKTAADTWALDTSTFVTTADTGTVTSTMIADGTIVNADINASAAIAHSKLANATAGQVLIGTTTTGVVTATTVTGDVTITGAGVTAISSGVIVDADVSSTAAIAHSKLANATAGQVLLGTTTTGVVTATTVSGDVTITGAGVTAIASGVIVNADINASAAIDKTKISGTAITAADTGTVTSTMIADGTIVNADISSTAAIDIGKIADVTIDTKTSNYTLALTDKNKFIEMNLAGTNTVSVPTNASVAFPIGSQIHITQYGAGKTQIVAVTPATTTIRSTPGTYLRAQYSSATLVKRATDEWYLVGDLSAT